MATVIEDLIASLDRGLERRALTVEQACIGVFYTAVRLSDGHVGVAFTPRDMGDTVCCPRSAAQLPEAGKLGGQSAWNLARQALSPFRLRRAVGVATINALSASLMAEKDIPGGRIVGNTDALDMVGFARGDTVVLVGAFTPFIKRLKDQVRLRVIDKHRDALKGDELSLWVSPDGAAAALADADVVVITGSALVEGGMDDLLKLSAGAREIVLAGPTASPWPEPFFARNVSVLGGIRVHDGPRFMRLVAEGGSGYFFTGSSEKIAVVKDRAS